eukprot:TRINITY_DN687_c0_g1_i12.p1 TRINITY_DN687_c0_g1~~TRINITY_DN687_c0_g1_i12.p1  ORF type:complete len:382 (+),score=87.05 TRINITY_DN687_c0_g1_i12:258-1403(+)
MEVSVSHLPSGRSCVVSVSDSDTVLNLKVQAVADIFGGPAHPSRAAGLVARIGGYSDDLDDTQRVAETPLESGGDVHLAACWVEVKPAEYSLQEHVPQYITVSRCGRLCLVGCTKGDFSVFDTNTAAEVATLDHGATDIWGAAFSHCGAWVATCSSDSTICVWCTSTWQCRCELTHSAAVWSAAWTAGGRLVSGDSSGAVLVWDLADPAAPTSTLLGRHSGAVFGLVASVNHIFTGSDDGDIFVWDIHTLTRTASLDRGEDGRASVHHLALSSDELHLVSASDNQRINVWCTVTLSCLHSMECKQTPYVLAVSQESDRVAVLGSRSTDVWCLSTGQLVGRLGISSGEGIAFSACGKYLFTAEDTSVRVRALYSLQWEDLED